MIEIKNAGERAESYLSSVLDELKDKPIELTGFRRNPAVRAEDDLLVLFQNNSSVVIKLNTLEVLLVRILKLEYIPDLFWNYKDDGVYLADFLKVNLLVADNPDLLDNIYEDIAVKIVRRLTRGKKINTDKIIKKVLAKYGSELSKYRAY